MSIVILGVDLGKNLCSVVGLDATGTVVLRRSMRRQTVLGFVSKLPACVVAMEACCGAHHLGRLLAAQGHTVKLMSPEYVQPYVKAQKNDDRDAEGIAEAASRPTMRFVELKSEEQLDTQTLHRVRSRLVAARKTLLNQLRAILFERGHAFPAGRRKLELAVDAILVDPDYALAPRIRQLVADTRAEWRALDEQIDALNGEFVALAKADEATRRLVTIPGVGVLNATALVAAIAMARPSGADAISALGWASCRSSTPLAANRSCWASQSAVILICACSSSTARGRLCRPCQLARRRWAPGCAACSRERTATSRWWRGQQAGADRLGNPAPRTDLRTGPRPRSHPSSSGPPRSRALPPEFLCRPLSPGRSASHPAPSETAAWGATPIDQLMCRIEIRRTQGAGIYQPVGLKPIIGHPAFDGVTDWGGGAVDPVTQTFVVNTMEMPFKIWLMRRDDPRVPALMKKKEGGENARIAMLQTQYNTPYVAVVKAWIGIFGAPCSAPPWGHLTAVDLKTRQVKWRKVFGTARDTGLFGTHFGVPVKTGVPNLGGAIITAGGSHSSARLRTSIYAPTIFRPARCCGRRGSPPERRRRP